MLGKLSQKFCIRSATTILGLIFVYGCTISVVLADSQHYKDPILQTHASTYFLHDNLSEISFAELNAKKVENTLRLARLQQADEARAASEKKLFDSLIAYDDVRLQIADIIKKLVDEYGSTGEYKKKLLGYSDTFNTKIIPARNDLQNLDEYKVYSTYFAVVYISLLYTFKENPIFYSQYMSDINNPSTTIGKYRNELEISYRDVKIAHTEYEPYAIAQNLEKSIVRLTKEIRLRRARSQVQNKVSVKF